MSDDTFRSTAQSLPHTRGCEFPLAIFQTHLKPFCCSHKCFERLWISIPWWNMIIRWCHGLLDLSQLLRYHELGSEDNGNTKALTNSAQKEMTAQVTSANAPSLFLGERSIPPLRGHRHESLDQWKFTCINSVLATNYNGQSTYPHEGTPTTNVALIRGY